MYNRSCREPYQLTSHALTIIMDYPNSFAHAVESLFQAVDSSIADPAAPLWLDTQPVLDRFGTLQYPTKVPRCMTTCSKPCFLK